MHLFPNLVEMKLVGAGDGDKNTNRQTRSYFIISDQLSALSTAGNAETEAIHHAGETVTPVTFRPGNVGNAAHLRQQQQQLLHLQQIQQQQQQQTYAGVLRSQAQATQASEARQGDLDPIARIRNLGTKGSHFSSALL